MYVLFWDASALIKRYLPELGRDTVNAFFNTVSRGDMLSTPWGYAETYSILLRRRNADVLDTASFTVAVTALQDEVVDDEDFRLLTIDDATVFDSIAMMHRHNLNATDAALLTLLLTYAHSVGTTQCVLVAADQRLLRAASAEGLTTVNPELLPVSDVPGFLALLA